MKIPNMSMKIPAIFLFCVLFSSLSCCIRAETPTQTQSYETQRFLRCLRFLDANNSMSQVIYTPRNSSYNSTLLSNIQNARFPSSVVTQPSVIITPLQYVHVQSVVSCAKTNGLRVKVRCGGHDFEGLSSISTFTSPFVLVDMRNLTTVSVNATARTAWVQGGSRMGLVNYRIAQSSPNLAFPSGVCPSVGAGGYMSGGGQGSLSRNYGTASDNVIDAIIVNANGEILDRKSMGEDLFWAIRGGGGASFGIILAFKINLVAVPSTVTVFRVNKVLEQNATRLIYLWQKIGPKVDRKWFLRVAMNQVTRDGKVTVQASFQSVFFGRIDKLLPLAQKVFPELGLKREDCREVRWIEAALFFAGLPSNATVDDLIRTEPFPKAYYKIKSDYVVDPISEKGLEGFLKIMKEDAALISDVTFTPYGGRMDEISESEIPFPHRAGNLYNIEYLVIWTVNDNANAQRYINWMRKLYRYMTPYVSKSPRAVYYNFRDLELGTNNEDYTSFAQANSSWGFKCFKNNFKRLASVKELTDPTNFFRYEQSIPLLSSLIKMKNVDNGQMVDE